MSFKNIFILFLTLLIVHNCSFKRSNNDFNGISSAEPATKWQDALISGSGKMGILVYGDPHNERIIYNHEFLYEYLGGEEVAPPDISDKLPEVKRLIKEGKYEEAKNLTLKTSYERGYPGLLWTDPYHPAGALLIKQDFDGKVENYSRDLNFLKGEITVKWKAGENEYQRKSFVSRTDNVIVNAIKADNKGLVNVDLQFTLQIDSARLKQINMGEWANSTTSQVYKIPADSLKAPLINCPEITTDKDWLILKCSYQFVNRGWEVLTRVYVKGGNNTLINNTMHIKNADEVMTVSSIIPYEEGNAKGIEHAREIITDIGSSYSELMGYHEENHRRAFDRLKFNLDTSGGFSGSTEALIADQKKREEINPVLLQKMFEMGRFALLSSSGDNPPNLMGIWNGEWRPAWSGDFTTDANINLQIAGACIGNMPEAIYSYTKMLNRIAPDWETNAKNIYGCRGYLSGTRTSGRRGFHTHFSDDFPGHYWTAGAEWLLLPCYEYYLCTGDEQYLKDMLLPMMKKTVMFYEDFLSTTDDNGKLFFAPSYSPENHPLNLNGESAVANATMDIAAAKEAISNLISICRDLNIEQENIAKWERLLAHMPPYLINDDGALQEWALGNLEDNYDHRHVSHLYPVWPGHEISPEETPEIFKAAQIAAQKRGRGNGSAHGLAHMALIGARLKNSDIVYGNLLFMLKNNYLNTSLFTNHNPGVIYNSDALCSLPAVIMEALAYSKPGIIELLPAWSDKMPDGGIEGMACRTMAVIEEMKWSQGTKKCSAKIKSLTNQQLKIVYRKGFSSYKSSMKAEKIDDITLLVNMKKDDVIKIVCY